MNGAGNRRVRRGRRGGRMLVLARGDGLGVHLWVERFNLGDGSVGDRGRPRREGDPLGRPLGGGELGGVRRRRPHRRMAVRHGVRLQPLLPLHGGEGIGCAVGDNTAERRIGRRASGGGGRHVRGGHAVAPAARRVLPQEPLVSLPGPKINGLSYDGWGDCHWWGVPAIEGDGGCPRGLVGSRLLPPTARSFFLLPRGKKRRKLHRRVRHRLRTAARSDDKGRKRR